MTFSIQFRLDPEVAVSFQALRALRNIARFGDYEVQYTSSTCLNQVTPSLTELKWCNRLS